MAVIGLLHPGEMGSAIGALLADRGHQVRWASDGRGPATTRRAPAAGLEDAGTVSRLAAGCAVLLSVCPPHAAEDVAGQVAAAGFGGLYLDANAISPASARSVAHIVQKAGATYVDGGIVGPPPRVMGTTRLYLSGQEAVALAEVFEGSRLQPVVLAGEGTAASALKMAYAGWTKGSAALLLAMQAAARAYGVETALLEEWRQSLPELPARATSAAQAATTKGWRWIAEMEEIAATLEAAGLPPGFHQAAAEVFRRPDRREAAQADAETVEQVLSALLRSDAPG